MALIWRSRPDARVRTRGCVGCLPIPVGCTVVLAAGLVVALVLF